MVRWDESCHKIIGEIIINTKLKEIIKKKILDFNDDNPGKC